MRPNHSKTYIIHMPAIGILKCEIQNRVGNHLVISSICLLKSSIYMILVGGIHTNAQIAWDTRNGVNMIMWGEVTK